MGRRLTNCLMLAASMLAATFVVAAAPAAAATVPSIESAHFLVTLTGSQTTTWSMDHTRYDGCVKGDVRTTGSGRQHFTFATSAPLKVTASRYNGSVSLSAGMGGIPVKGSVEHQTAIEVTQISGGESACGGTDNPQAPPVPDCGTRSWSGTVQPMIVKPANYYGAGLTPLTPVLSWEGPSLADPVGFNSLFTYCPGIVGDAIAQTPNSGIVHRIAFAAPTKFTVTGSDVTSSTSDSGFTRNIDVRWTATFVPTGASALQPCTVPKLRGLRVPAAKRALVKAKCRVGAVRLVHGPSTSKGKVLGSTPKAGTRTTARVVLVVGKGPKPPS
jgi:hypothetical protein